MGVCSRPWPSGLRPRTNEGKLLFAAERAHLPFGDRHAVKCALAVIALTSQVTLSWAIVNFQPLPLSVVTLSDDQMAKIKG